MNVVNLKNTILAFGAVKVDIGIYMVLLLNWGVNDHTC